MHQLHSPWKNQRNSVNFSDNGNHGLHIDDDSLSPGAGRTAAGMGEQRDDGARPTGNNDSVQLGGAYFDPNAGVLAT